jgi:hypothetical protein
MTVMVASYKSPILEIGLYVQRELFQLMVKEV